MIISDIETKCVKIEKEREERNVGELPLRKETMEEDGRVTPPVSLTVLPIAIRENHQETGNSTKRQEQGRDHHQGGAPSAGRAPTYTRKRYQPSRLDSPTVHH